MKPSRTKPNITLIHQILTLLVLVALPLFVSWRVKIVDQFAGSAFGLVDVYDLAVVNADAPLMAIIVLMLLGAWYCHKYIAIFLRTAAVLLILFYLGDLVVLKNFGIRILFTSVQQYGQDTGLVWEQLEQFLGGTWPLILKLLILAAFFASILFPIRKPNRLLIIAYSFFIFLATTAALLPWKVDYVNSWIIQNYLNANLFVPQARTYSAAAKQDIFAQADEVQQCSRGLSNSKNVIILLVESWSPYQSQLFSGLNNWTPELDSIAQQAVIYPDMHANGFSTNTGLIGLLGGVRVYAPFAHIFRFAVAFRSAWGIGDTLPELFNSNGYHTAFLTTGPLSFSSKGPWLKDIGFAETDDNQNSFYESWEKVQFGAATDEALYNHSLEWISARPDEQPWMLTLETVSTHQPYLHPETGKPDLEGVFRFADHQAGNFIQTLQATNYFDDGILLVMGDHRSMTPMTDQEDQLLGQAAFSKVPFFILGGGQAFSHPGTFQLSDILPSFRYWLSDEVCQSENNAVLFDRQAEGRCAFHIRGADPSLVDVFCPQGQGQVKLNGDDTAFIQNSGISTEKQDELIRVIGQQRLQGQQRHSEHEQYQTAKSKPVDE